MKKGTRLIHSGSETSDQTGAVSTPIYQSVVFAQTDATTYGQWVYSRNGNPTRAILEKTIADLEGGESGFAFSSGMAAISVSLLLFGVGDHIIMSRDVYGGTYRIGQELLPRYGIEVGFVDAADIKQIEGSTRPNTKALYFETPSNPLMKITDLRRTAAWAQEHGIITICDNTFMSPYLQRPLASGIDIVVHSATKYLGGHSDCLAGLVVTSNKELAERVKFMQSTLGAVLGPQDSWLIMRGIKTLKVRMEQQQYTAALLAEWLGTQPGIAEVIYPGLPGHPGRDIHLSQADGFGGMLAFRLKDGETARRFVNGLRLITIASSLGGVESLVSIPSAISHSSLTGEQGQQAGVTPELVRISVGLEDPEDLKADISQALQSIRGT